MEYRRDGNKERNGKLDKGNKTMDHLRRLCMQTDYDYYEDYEGSLDKLRVELTKLTKSGQEIKAKDFVKCGQKLGDYRLNKKLGIGSFGQVFLAIDTRSNDEVAIKVPQGAEIRKNGKVGKEDLKEFYEEIYKMANVSCSNDSNIVRLLGFGRQGKVPFVVEEYMPGGTLKNRVKDNNGRIVSMEEVAECMEGAGNGSAEVHDKGYVHRDIKPGNLLLEENRVEVSSQESGADPLVNPGQRHPDESSLANLPQDIEKIRVKLVDFGLAAKAGTKGYDGTYYYMAPEQVKGEACCPQTDVYALGVTALELYTGDNPQRRIEKYMNYSYGQDQGEQINKWRRMHESKWWRYKKTRLEKFGYMSKKLPEWIILKHISKTNADEKDREFYLFLSRAVDKDPKKRPDARAFVRGLWQAVGKQSKETLKETLREEDDVLEEFYEIPNQDGREKYYLNLSEEGRKQLLPKLTLGYCLDLYQSLESQKGQDGRESRDHIELYEKLEPKQQRKLYRMLESTQEKALFRDIGAEGLSNLYIGIKEQKKRIEFINNLGAEGLSNLYIGMKEQKERTNLDRMLTPDAKKKIVRSLGAEELGNLYMDMKEQKKRIEFINNLGAEGLSNLYIDMKEQKERTKLYRMLTLDAQKNIISSIGAEDIVNLYMDIKGQKKRIEFINNLGAEGLSNLYIDMKEQKERTKLYRMLAPWVRIKIISSLGSEELGNLYQSLKKQRMHTNLYKMLTPEQRQMLVTGLEGDDVRNLYLDIKSQEERTKLLEMLNPDQVQALGNDEITAVSPSPDPSERNNSREIQRKIKCFGRNVNTSDGRRFLESCWSCFGRPRIKEER
jgi:serine/threonine protein kinase